MLSIDYSLCIVPCVSQEEAILSRWGLNVENEIIGFFFSLFFTFFAFFSHFFTFFRLIFVSLRFFHLIFAYFTLHFRFRFLVFRIEVNHVKSGFFFASKRNKIFASISNFASEAKVRAHPTCEWRIPTSRNPDKNSEVIWRTFFIK